MKSFLISCILLLFEQNLCHGYAISKIKSKALQEHKSSEVYGIKETPDGTLKTIVPRPEVPTLRELIYYHVIETPYGQEKKPAASVEELDFDDTRRPWTNSHGFQFLIKPDESEESNEHDPIESDSDDSNDDSNSEDDDENDGDDSDGEEGEDEFDQDSDDAADPSNNSDTTESEDSAIAEDPEESSTNEDTDNDTPVIDERIKEDITTKPDLGDDQKDESAEEDIEVTTPRRDDVAEEKKIARNALFSQARSKYQSVNRRHEKAVNRRKRELLLDPQDIPEPPTLPEFDFDILPADLRRRLSTPKPPKYPSSQQKQSETDQYSEDSFKEELAQKIEEMIADIRPGGEHVQGSSGSDQGSSNKGSKRKARTYGMKLTKDRGVVWNNLWSEPGMVFNVGNLETVEDHEKETNNENNMAVPAITDENIDKEPIMTSIAHPTESKPIYVDSGEIPHAITDGNGSNEEDIEDIFIGKPKLTDDVDEAIDIDERFKEKLRKESENKKDHDGNENVPLDDEEKLREENDDKDTSNEENLDEEKPDDGNEKKKTTDEDEVVKRDNEGSAEEKGSEDSKKKDKDEDSEKEEEKKGHVDPSELFKEIMNNEEFWNWLGDWTATYMEVLMKHVKRMVHDEVSRQMKNFAANFKKTEEDKKNLKDEAENKKQDKENKEKDTVHENKDKTDKKDAIKDEKDAAKTKKNDAKEEKDENKDNKKTKDKIIIDGKEIPLTHNSNLEKGVFKHKHDKDDNKLPVISNNNKKDNPITVNGNNIFGNAVGSDKVTNIFIFYPQDEEEYEDDVNSKGSGENYVLDKFDANKDDEGNEKDENKITVTDKKDRKTNNDTNGNNKEEIDINTEKKSKIEEKINNNIDKNDSRTNKHGNEKDSKKIDKNSDKKDSKIDNSSDKQDHKAIEASDAEKSQLNDKTKISDTSMDKDGINKKDSADSTEKVDDKAEIDKNKKAEVSSTDKTEDSNKPKDLEKDADKEQLNKNTEDNDKNEKRIEATKSKAEDITNSNSEQKNTEENKDQEGPRIEVTQKSTEDNNNNAEATTKAPEKQEVSNMAESKDAEVKSEENKEIIEDQEKKDSDNAKETANSGTGQ